MGGGGGGNTETVQKADPWGGQQPYLQRLYGRAEGLEEQEAYPGQTYADPSQESLLAQDWMARRAIQGSPVAATGQEAVRAAAAGEYLYGGPLFDRAFQAAARKVTPQVSGAFSKAGRYGSGLHQESLARGLGDSFTDLYSRERGLQMSAAAMSPQMAASDYADIQALQQAGAISEARDQQEINEQIARWQFEQQAPYQQVQAQSGVIQGGFPGSQTVTDVSGAGPSTTQGALGGAATGASIGSYWGPYGALAGGAIGGAGGYLGTK